MWPARGRGACPRSSAAWACWRRPAPKPAGRIGRNAHNARSRQGGRSRQTRQSRQSHPPRAPARPPPRAGGRWCGGRGRGGRGPGGGGARFGAERAPALECVSLRVQPGEIVALVGPSGAGKTTLVNLLPRFVLPTSARILLDGKALPDWDLGALRAQFAMGSQDVVLLNDSIACNVALGRAVDEKRVHECLAAAHLAGHVAALPPGIHTVAGHNAAELAGGQRQRRSIARALYKDARVLILDEATSGLDTESERLVQQALQRLMQGRTTLVIAHRLSAIEHADRVLVTERGRIAEQGTHREFMGRGGLYARLQARAARGKVLARGAAGV